MEISTAQESKKKFAWFPLLFNFLNWYRVSENKHRTGKQKISLVPSFIQFLLVQSVRKEMPTKKQKNSHGPLC